MPSLKDSQGGVDLYQVKRFGEKKQKTKKEQKNKKRNKTKT